jgi:hypothetical protein
MNAAALTQKLLILLFAVVSLKFSLRSSNIFVIFKCKKHFSNFRLMLMDLKRWFHSPKILGSLR